MAGRTPRTALTAFVDPLQQSLSCITYAGMVYRSYGNNEYPNEQPHVITINDGDPTPLLCDSNIHLSFRMFYQIVEDETERGPWKATVSGYYYSLDDGDQKEIFAYHWHPTIGPIHFPHLHIEQGSGAKRPELFRAHLPTGRIALEDMILCTIHDFHVQPLRDDWNDILSNNANRFRTWRTWG